MGGGRPSRFPEDLTLGPACPPETARSEQEARNLRDIAVIEALRNGGMDADEAWRELFERHRPLLFSIAYRFTGDYGEADELVQEILVRVFRQLPRYDPRSSFSAWLASVARNHCIDRYRVRVRERRRAALSEVALEQFAASPRLNPDQLYQRRETRDNLRRALELLSRKLREVVEMRFFEELSYEDIGARLGVPEGTVKSRIHRGRAELKRRLVAMREQPETGSPGRKAS